MIFMFRYWLVSILKPSVMADMSIQLMKRNTMSVASAELPAHPETCSKNLIPVFLSNVICAKKNHPWKNQCVCSGA